MRSLIVLPAIVAVAAAQSESISLGPIETREPFTSADNIQPSATLSAVGPINTDTACAQISEILQGLLDEGITGLPSVTAELAFTCLKSVPISDPAASSTIESLKKALEMQSTLSYLKKPPAGYPHEGVDIMGELDKIGSRVSNGEYNNEFDFEVDIASLLVKGNDGHLGFDGMAYGGVFRWRRSREIALISASSDGKEAPKLWAIQDFNQTSGGSKRGAVSKINGKDAVQFLEEESARTTFHDNDAKYNAMVYMQPADSFGLFSSPAFYPGVSTTVEFEDGSSKTFPNSALILDPESWSSVDDGASFYNRFIRLRSNNQKRGTHNVVPRRLQLPKEADIDGEAVVPPSYPDPIIGHSASDVPLAGYFIETAAGTVGVLMIQTFNVDTSDGVGPAEEFQQVIERYLAEAEKRQVSKHIVDLRTNGGGLVMLGYDAYLQFFPSQKPQLQSRYRAVDATNILGSQLSTLEFNRRTAEFFSTPFNFHSYQNKDLTNFSSWEDLFGPEKFNDDSFTKLLRYNLSDPLVSSDDRLSVGIEMTGYGSRSNFKERFKAQDIVLLTDGICASTCSLFTELMVQQSGVKTISLGGRPAGGPMQAVGGTKGSLVLNLGSLDRISSAVLFNFPTSQSEAQEWAESLPIYDGIDFADATVNFQDNIRKGLEKDGIPTQFLNDSSSCRMWYKAEEYLNVTSLWTRVAEVAFGKDGGLDEGSCVPGSVSTKEAQQGVGEGSPTSPEGTANVQPGKPKGAAARIGSPVGGVWTAGLVLLAVALSLL